MSKRIQRKFGISRRIGVALWGSAKDPVHKRNYPPGQHGASKGRQKKVGVGEQWQTVNVFRHYYGYVLLKQFARVVQEAVRKRGDNVENLVGLMESRLATVVYRAKFAPTIFAARQIINHGHILVNGKRVNIASYKVKPNDVITVREKSKELAIILESTTSGERTIPDYIQIDEHNKLKAIYSRIPAVSDVPYPVDLRLSLIIERFSR